ncbi:hypothetical protein L5515_016469 [Caenorhabditis briggsae]|uniref:Uncharacterized protein n=1 Tax=Caenorhabditis briggsae TaxID=6238 RepID=A0AAE9JPY8_CAEBR|nr:hypothetical protein L5515_016469 [Caenorhabditis briggsae]
MAETDLIPVQYEALRRKRNRRIWEIQKKFHEELNEVMKKKEKKIEELIADLEKDLGGEEKDEGRGVWQMVFHPIQYFWGSRKEESQKPTMKRTMEIDADEEEPETKRRWTGGRKRAGLQSVKLDVAELN